MNSMADTYQKIASTMETNLTSVQDYVQRLQNSKGKIVDSETKVNIEKFSEVIKYMNNELHERIERTMGEIESGKLQTKIQRDKQVSARNLDNDPNMTYEY